MGALDVVCAQIGIQVLLYFLDTVLELLATHDSEVLIQQGWMQSFDEAV